VRLAVGGVRHETNTFSTLRTGPAEFRVERGDEAVAGPFWAPYRDEGVELVGTLVAGAPPHGLVESAAYGALKGELLERLERATPVDGVYLDLHGAMEVEQPGGGWDDGEGDLAAAVRRVVGERVPIAASLDLHGNLSPELIAACDVLTALRTAPHRDGEATRRRAIGHLLRCLREGRRPVTAMLKPPILLPGEWAVTDVEPAGSLYAGLAELERRPGLLDGSIMIGCAWTDSRHTSTAALVVAWEREDAEREASALAEQLWRRRAEFRPEGETARLDEAIGRALASSEAPVFVSDSGDNVTAGGAGDLTLVLGELLARLGGAGQDGSRALVAGIADAAAVGACAAAGEGGRVGLALGGKLDRVNGRPLPLDGAVQRVDGRAAVVRSGGVDVAITADRRAFTQLADYRELGLDTLAYQVVVVKLGYLFPELRRVAARAVMALTPGFTDLELSRLPYRRLRRPIYPLDPGMEWSAG
jgi:microcystin degradation protein MlrC